MEMVLRVRVGEMNQDILGEKRRWGAAANRRLYAYDVRPWYKFARSLLLLSLRAASGLEEEEKKRRHEAWAREDHHVGSQENGARGAIGAERDDRTEGGQHMKVASKK
jgi:hypothetical protein